MRWEMPQCEASFRSSPSPRFLNVFGEVVSVPRLTSRVIYRLLMKASWFPGYDEKRLSRSRRPEIHAPLL
jgi:hypothetical protein